MAPTKNPKVNLRPLGNRVLVAREEAHTTTPGGIVLPTEAQEAQQFGVVISVGPGKKLPSGEREVMDVKPGNRIMFGRFSETDVHLGGTKAGSLILLREDDIFAVIDE